MVESGKGKIGTRKRRRQKPENGGGGEAESTEQKRAWKIGPKDPKPTPNHSACQIVLCLNVSQTF